MNLTLDVDSNLVSRCKKNDRGAQRMLYEKYKRAMFNTAIRIVKDEMDAQDILQDAFIDAFTKIDQLRNRKGFGGWLKRIVVNKALNHVKKNGKLVSMEKEDVVADEGYREMDYSIDDVQKALMNLSDGYRAVFTLFAFEGYSHKEIAEELDISESTSKSQYKRAKKRIKEQIINNSYGRE